MYRIFLICCLLCAGCSYRSDQPVVVQQTRKPVVAFIPVVDRSEHQLPWNLPEEISEGIARQIQKRGQLALVDLERIQVSLASVSATDLLSPNVEFAKQFKPADFVVVAEILEHARVPYHKGAIRPMYTTSGTGSSVLKMTFHIKVIDIRKNTPKVILQEVFSSNHLISKKDEKIDYLLHAWPEETFASTPIGVAHARLQRDLVQRVEWYVDYVK